MHDRRATHVVDCGYMRLAASYRPRRVHRRVGRVRRGRNSRERGGVCSVVPERLPNACERALALDKRDRVVAAVRLREQLLKRLCIVCGERHVGLVDKLLVRIIFHCRTVPVAVRKRSLLNKNNQSAYA